MATETQPRSLPVDESNNSKVAASAVEFAASVVAKVSHSPTDLDWIQETLSGNPNAFSNIIQKYQPKFLSMAMRILGNQMEAEDVLQDAFIEAYRHLPDFRNKSRFSTWLYSVVLNHIRNQLRHNRVVRWTPLETSDDDDELKPLNIPEKSVPLDIQLDRKLQIEAIQEVVRTFPPKFQAIFVSFYFDGMLIQDIAEQLNCPLGTVKSYLHRARKLVAKRLKVDATEIESPTD